MTSTVSFETKGGGSVKGELAEPSGTGKVGAVIVLQEWWGLNAHIKSLVDRFATAGFLALAPDLYRGEVATDPGEAMKLANALDTLEAVKEIAGAAAYLKAHARGNGKVGVVGFCLGGALALAAGCHVEGLSAIVPFYGIPPAAKVDYAKMSAPVLAHFGAKDTHATVAKAEAVKKELDALGKPMELAVYDAGHAFMNDTRPEAYDEPSAKLAWKRTLDLFEKQLA